MLSVPEAQALGAACDRVLAEYIDTTVSRKMLAWTNLIGVISGTYGGRIIHYKARTAGAKQVAQAQRQPAHNVHPMGIVQ
jgi:hypothetical protein